MAKVYQDTKDLTFTSMAQYRLHIQGYIDLSWSDRLGGLTITSTFDENKKPLTLLEGRVEDQSQLVGIINSIYEMHLSLISVELIKTLSSKTEISSNIDQINKI